MELVRRGMTASRAMAQEQIESGNVVVGGAPAFKSSRLVAPEESVVVRQDDRRFVSRGGEKLEHALREFEISVAGRRALDAGASTGGFADCLLKHGATEVIAVDVGHGQLHERLRTDPRVTVIDRTNIRYLTLADLPFPGATEVVVADLSFISLRVVASVLLDLAVADADVVVLVKPQFEAGRAAVAKGRGVISDLAVWRDAIVGVREAFATAGAGMVSVVASPLLGAEGNAEFLMHLRAGESSTSRNQLELAVDAAIDVAVEKRRKTATHHLIEGG
ncbi:MAG TPA: TlyA family RNA methyltransferase [Acidimicrobiales bacterium]|nr:TlyA family RNA methyltransferase [Acidimicrobiales bacterium]